MTNLTYAHSTLGVAQRRRRKRLCRVHPKDSPDVAIGVTLFRVTFLQVALNFSRPAIVFKQTLCGKLRIGKDIRKTAAVAQSTDAVALIQEVVADKLKALTQAFPDGRFRWVE